MREPADKMDMMLVVGGQTNHFDLCDCIQDNLSFHIGTLLILREGGEELDEGGEGGEELDEGRGERGR